MGNGTTGRDITNLRDLYLHDCKKVTDAGLRSLQSALPGKYILE